MKYKYITSIVIISFTVVVSAMSIITPDKEISDLEGRRLQELPIPSKIINKDFNRNAYLYEMLTGEMFKKFDNYFSDHVYLRDNMVNSYSALQGRLDKKYVNGVYLCEDNYIISPPDIKGINNEILDERVKHFNEFSAKFNEAKSYIVNVPIKSMVYGEKFPTGNYTDKYNEFIDYMFENIDNNYIETLNFRNEIDKNEDLHYKTDHHLSMDGAFQLYEYIIESIGKDFKEIGYPLEKSDFKIDIYERYFVGSDGKKVAQLVKESDNIQIYNHKEEFEYKVYNQNGDTKFIDYKWLTESNLRSDNDYAVYLSGDNPIIKVENLNPINDIEIVMVGDSMDNPLVQLLMPHFKNIYSFDLRHYKGDITKAIEEINPDIIMYIGTTMGIIKEDEIDGDVFKW